MPPCPDEYLPTRPMTIPQIINHCLELLHRHSDPSGEKDLIQRYVRFLLSGRYIDDEENQHRVFLSHPAAQLETIRLQAFYTGVHGQSRFFPTIEEIVLFPIDLGTRMEKDVGYVVIDLPAGVRPAIQPHGKHTYNTQLSSLEDLPRSYPSPIYLVFLLEISPDLIMRLTASYVFRSFVERTAKCA